MTIDMMFPDTEGEVDSTTIPRPTAVTSEDLTPNDETKHNTTTTLIDPSTQSPRAVSGAPAVTPYPPPSHRTISSSTEEPSVTAPLLSLYYQHLFPYDFIYQWFRYGTGTNSSSGGNSMNLFLHREFSFTIQNPQKDEIYLRYQSYASESDFASAVQKRCPMKIDIGAIFSHPPVQKHTLGSALTPIEREFVLDIDLTDYDDIRNCGCQQAQICPVCWKYMSMAMATLNVALREDFGFHHLQWFYSGRRGIHGWICDAAAKTLTDAGRTAVANYLTVNLGTEKNQDVHLSYPLHPYIHRAYEILEPFFIRDVIVSKKNGGHGLLYSEDQYMQVLNLLPECAAVIREMLQESWSTKKSTPLERWNDLKKHISFFIKQGNFSSGRKNSTEERSKKVAKTLHVNYEDEKNRQLLEIFCVEIVIRYTYPRIDINVSKMRNHLLKSPFCVHPKTGRVCVPISKTEHRTFDPFAVPTISQIVQEYFAATKAAAPDSSEKGDDEMVISKDPASKQSCRHKWEHTSLYPYYTKFQNEFLIPLTKESLSYQRQNVTDRKDAVNMDF